MLPELAESGDYEADLLDNRQLGFTETHFFRAAEFESLLNDAGLDITSLVGLEGSYFDGFVEQRGRGTL